jgi:hypothetical protein
MPRRGSRRLEGRRRPVPVSILRDAPLRRAPQDEVYGFAPIIRFHRLREPYTRSSICRDKMAANSSANPSRRCACLFTSDVNLL